MSLTCPCCSGRKANDCCEPFLKGKIKPDTAEELMRSRYTAFVFKDAKYLLRTHRGHQSDVDLKVSLEQTFCFTQWLGLTILDKENGQGKDHLGVVEFEARYLDLNRGKEELLRERSRFVKEKGQWLYITD